MSAYSFDSLSQKGIKDALRVRPFVLLMISFGLAGGAVTALLSLLQQIMSAQGYSDVWRRIFVIVGD